MGCTRKEKEMRYYLFLVILVFVFAGCADSLSFTQATSATPVGFWYGLWHGVILPFAWVGSLLDIAIYAIYNNGGWYDFGFFFGVGGLSSGLLNMRGRK